MVATPGVFTHQLAQGDLPLAILFDKGRVVIPLAAVFELENRDILP